MAMRKATTDGKWARAHLQDLVVPGADREAVFVPGLHFYAPEGAFAVQRDARSALHLRLSFAQRFTLR